jgi:hypothetical protein
MHMMHMSCHSYVICLDAYELKGKEEITGLTRSRARAMDPAIHPTSGSGSIQSIKPGNLMVCDYVIHSSSIFSLTSRSYLSIFIEWCSVRVKFRLCLSENGVDHIPYVYNQTKFKCFTNLTLFSENVFLSPT